MQFVAPDKLRSPHIRVLAAWYEAARPGDGWPPRDAFRPESLPPATLPHLGMVDIEPDPFRVFYRVLGSVVTDSFGGGAVQMRYLDELDWPQQADLEAIWRRTHAEAGPRYLQGSQRIEGIAIFFEACALPLGALSDPVRRYVIAEDYLDGRAWRQAIAKRGYRLDE